MGRLTYRGTNRNHQVRDYKKIGTITTAFDMRVQDDLDLFHVVGGVNNHVPHLESKAPT